jgi:hypothetical protein
MLAMAAIAVSTSAVASAQYDYTKINIPKSIFTQATGISNKGEIVGVYALVPDHVTQISGFWRTNDIPAIWQYPLTDPKAEQDTWVSAIDSGRIIVGNYDNLSGDNVGMFLNGGTYSDFGVTGCQSTFVNGINDSWRNRRKLSDTHVRSTGLDQNADRRIGHLRRSRRHRNLC